MSLILMQFCMVLLVIKALHTLPLHALTRKCQVVITVPQTLVEPFMNG